MYNASPSSPVRITLRLLILPPLWAHECLKTARVMCWPHNEAGKLERAKVARSRFPRIPLGRRSSLADLLCAARSSSSSSRRSQCVSLLTPWRFIGLVCESSVLLVFFSPGLAPEYIFAKFVTWDPVLRYKKKKQQNRAASCRDEEGVDSILS